MSKFPDFFSRIFLYFHIFLFFFQILECEAFQILCPLLILNFGNVFCFSCFSWKKKRGTSGKKMFDKNHNTREFCVTIWSHHHAIPCRLSTYTFSEKPTRSYIKFCRYEMCKSLTIQTARAKRVQKPCHTCVTRQTRSRSYRSYRSRVCLP